MFPEVRLMIIGQWFTTWNLVQRMNGVCVRIADMEMKAIGHILIILPHRALLTAIHHCISPHITLRPPQQHGIGIL
jgi:hypothetical protein